MVETGPGPEDTPHLPPELAEELERGEHPHLRSPVRVVTAPEARDGLGGVAVLTDDRIVIVPDAQGSPADRGPRPPLLEVLTEIWSLFAEPPTSTTRARAGLAGRARPGIDLPLEACREVFVSRMPRVLGVTLELPAPDTRAPFTLYLELESAEIAATWASRASALRSMATPRPELERPYSLYYLLHPPPRPLVRVRGPVERKGVLRLGPDGPLVGGTQAEHLMPYETIEALEWAEPSGWRKGRLLIVAAGREWTIAPLGRRQVAPLLDAGRLLGELSGRLLLRGSGPLRAGRIAVATAAGGGGIAAALWELLGAFM